MKALFFNKDLFMGTREIEYPHHEYRMPLMRTIKLTIHKELHPSETLMEKNMVYRLVDYSKNFAIYELKGIEE